MRTGWVEWNGERYYCHDETGEMLKNTTTPDGYILDNEGHLKNEQIWLGASPGTAGSFI